MHFYKIKYAESRVPRNRIGISVLSLLMAVCLMVTGLVLPKRDTYATTAPGDDLPVVDDAIWNYPSQFDDWVGEDVPVTVPLESLDWSSPPSVTHSGYDTGSFAYTPETSKKFNGYSTPDHVVFDDNTVRFLGYGQAPYMDMVFTEEYPAGFDSMSFALHPVVMNFHSFSESGLLFNGSFTGQYYTGYALILKCGNMEGMLSGGTATLSLVYCENEKMDGNSYSPGTLASTRTLIGTYRTDINNLTTPAFDIKIDKYATGGGFMLYLDGQMVADVPNPKSSENGFGFFTGYYGHACTILTVMEFEQINTTLNFEPVETQPTVKFVDVNSVGTDTEIEIAKPQTAPVNAEKSYVGDKFKVTPPQNIGEYRYVRASRKPLDPITYKKSPENNVITLYYDLDIGVSKSASVDGMADNGTLDLPAPVSVGKNIDYTIDITNPSISRTVTEAPMTIADMWTGSNYNIMRTKDGDVYAWGFNASGQLGLGDSGRDAHRDEPTKNDTLSGMDITDVWCGAEYTIARTKDGDIYVWGDNTYGQLGLGDSGASTRRTTPTKNDTLSQLDITDVWCGSCYAIARTADGEIYVWGANYLGQLGLGDSGPNTNRTTPTKNDTLSQLNITAVWCANYNGNSEDDGGHTIARTKDGEIYVWGDNTWGQLGLEDFGANTNRTTPTKNDTLSQLDITDVWCGVVHNIARTKDGDVYVWGMNFFGQLGLGDTVGRDKPTKNDKLSDLDITNVWSGSYDAMARTKDGDVYVWGLNDQGQLGLGDAGFNTTRTEPTKNDTLSDLDITDIWKGGGHSIAGTSSGDVYVWGLNNYYQLGLGGQNPTRRIWPTQNNALHSRPKKFIVTDLLPVGLSLVKSDGDPLYSVTDEAGNPVDVGDLTVTTGEVSGREQITFEFNTLPHGTIKFNFKAKVEAAGSFENTGQFSDGMKNKTYDSNTTYHSTDFCAVTEKYQKWSGAQGDMLQGDTYRMFGPGLPEQDYSPYPSTMRPITNSSGSVWRYYAYQRVGIDSHPVVGQPPGGIENPDYSGADSQYPWCWKDVDDDHEIILYFVEDVNLHIEYKSNADRTGADLKLPYTASVPGMQDYFMAVSHMNPFDTWNYAGYYSLDGGTSVRQGVPPVKTFDAAQMTGNKHIILYFTKNLAITVQYREYRNDPQDRQNSQMLFNANGINKETFIVTSRDFDPMAQPSIADSITDGVKSFVNKQYKIYQGWSDDNGMTVHLGENPPVMEGVNTNKNIILYFSTTYNITEMFHENVAVQDDDPPLDPLMPNITTSVLSGDTFTGAPSPEIRDGDWIWTYVGYKIGTDRNIALLVSDEKYVPPIIANVAGDETIIYVYEKRQNPQNDVTIVERFREKDNTGQILQNNVSTNVAKDQEFPGNYPGTITLHPDQQDVRYTYWGYQLDNESPVQGAFPGITVNGGHTITYLYEVISDCTLHIRQIVLDPISGIQQPVMGYYTLTSNGTILPITSNSIVLPEFTDYRVKPSGNRKFNIFDIVPQYYKYAGCLVTDNEGDQNGVTVVSTPNGDIVVNYDDKSEWWVTVYITPEGTPGSYDWSWATNEFGKVYQVAPN